MCDWRDVLYVVCDWRGMLYVVCDWSGVHILCMTEEMCICCVYHLKKNSPLPFPCTCHNPRWCWADAQWWAQCCPWIQFGWSAEWGRQSPCRWRLWPHPAQGSWFCGAGSVPDTPAVSAPRCKPTTRSWQHCLSFLSSADLIHLITLSVFLVVCWSDTPDNTVHPSCHLLIWYTWQHCPFSGRLLIWYTWQHCPSFWSSADLIHLTTLSVFLVICWSDTPDNTVHLFDRLLIWYTWQHCPSFWSSADLIHLTTLSIFWSSADLIHLTTLSVFLVVCWSDTPDNTVRLSGRLLIWYTWQHCPSFWLSADLIHLTTLSIFFVVCWSDTPDNTVHFLVVCWSDTPDNTVLLVICWSDTPDNNVCLWCLSLLRNTWQQCPSLMSSTACFSPLALWSMYNYKAGAEKPQARFALTGTVVVSRILLVKISIYCKQNQQTVRLNSCYFAWPVLKY